MEGSEKGGRSYHLGRRTTQEPNLVLGIGFSGPKFMLKIGHSKKVVGKIPKCGFKHILLF